MFVERTHNRHFLAQLGAKCALLRNAKFLTDTPRINMSPLWGDDALRLNHMSHSVQTLIPRNLPQPLGPYSHIAKAGRLITISAIAGMEPETGKLVGPDAYSQVKQILRLCDLMLTGAESDLDHMVHMNLFLKNIEDLDDVDRACDEALGSDRPAGTVIVVPDLPKPGALVTMSLIATTSNPGD